MQLAPAARDGWLTGDREAYAALTGRDVPAAQLDVYRRRWDLGDLCVSAGWFVAPHHRNDDTEVAWQRSVEIWRSLAKVCESESGSSTAEVPSPS